MKPSQLVDLHLWAAYRSASMTSRSRKEAGLWMVGSRARPNILSTSSSGRLIPMYGSVENSTYYQKSLPSATTPSIKATKPDFSNTPTRTRSDRKRTAFFTSRSFDAVTFSYARATSLTRNSSMKPTKLAWMS